MVNQINLRYDFTDFDVDKVSFVNKTYRLDNVDRAVIQKITADDAFLSYVFYLACLQIGIMRISQDNSLIVGIPAFDGSGVRMLESKLSSTIFKGYLQEMKVKLEEVLQSEKNDDESNVVVSYEGVNQNRSVHYDIWFHIVQGETDTALEITYRSNRYKPSTLDILVNSIQYVINSCLNNLDIEVFKLFKINNKESAMIHQYNDSADSVDFRSLVSVPALFKTAVTNFGEKAAVIENDKCKTYRELEQDSNALAHYLKNKGIGPGQIVAVLNGRSIYTIISMLAVLKLGAAYAPIDANYPQKRINDFLNNLGIDYILTVNANKRLLNDGQLQKTAFIDDEWENIRVCSKEFVYEENMEALCYVIFTSGSTGAPKVTAIKHIGWSNLLKWFTDRYNITANDTVYLISSPSFDISQRSIFMALVNGATLHLYPDAIYDVNKIKDYIHKNQISILNCAPSTFYPLLEDDESGEYHEVRPLRCLFLGGEAIAAQRLVDWYQSGYCNAVISNVYGVAECSDVSSYYELADFDEYLLASVPVGRPIYNNKLFIVNEKGQQLPPGSIGEICISGVGNGAGYINDSNLTSEKFVQLEDGTEVYMTGDMGRFSGDYIEYCGRKDHQVKIRGNRVELGDIENAIRQIDAVREVAVVVNRSGHMVGYIDKKEDVTETDEQITGKVYQEMRKKLPSYMIPDQLILLDVIPLNQNGKIDRLKLSNMEIDTINKVQENATGLEKEVMDILANILGKGSVDINGNIFDQGMHSILVIKLVGILNRNYDVSFKPIDIYLNSTVVKIADKIRKF